MSGTAYARTITPLVGSPVGATLDACPPAPGRDNTRLVTNRFLGGSLLLIFAAAIAWNASYALAWDSYVRLARATSGLIEPTLVVGPLVCVVTVTAFVALGRLRRADFGLRGRDVLPGLLATVAIWCLIQLVETGLAIAGVSDLTLNVRWTRLGWAALVGQLVGQGFGIAALEEIFFRGYLLRQLVAHFTVASVHHRLTIAAAILLSQGAFSLYHVPNFVLFPSGVGITGVADAVLQLGIDLTIGVLFAALYLRTGNLFLVMGIHTLNNAPTVLVTPVVDGSIVLQAIALVLLLSTFARPFASSRRAALELPPAQPSRS